MSSVHAQSVGDTWYGRWGENRDMTAPAARDGGMATEEVAMLYPARAVERAMKVHEIIMRALDGQLTWIQAAEILGRSPRSIRRLL